jgi:hypothetical protein
VRAAPVVEGNVDLVRHYFLGCVIQLFGRHKQEVSVIRHRTSLSHYRRRCGRVTIDGQFDGCVYKK